MPRKLKPVSEITDRAKRYRAQKPDVLPLPPKQCMYCGSRKNVGVEHIDGNEDHGEPENLGWACKRCNATVAVWLKAAGIGKRVRQYNPGKKNQRRRSDMDAYAAAIKVMRGEFEGDLAKAIAVIKRTPRSVRSAYTSRTWPTRRQIYGPSGRAQGSLFGGSNDVPF